MVVDKNKAFKSPAGNMNLSSLTDLMKSVDEIESEKVALLKEIPLDLIDDFKDHPYKVREDEDMKRLVTSVGEIGVTTLALVRPKEDGRYELISGHRRKRACELNGIETLRCEIKDISDDEAIVLMVDSNFQREQILPSEKAFSYKMKLDAMSRQAGRPRKNNPTPVVSDLRTNEELGKDVGESREQIRRYVRLTYLIKPILDLVDENKIALRPAVEISYMQQDEQYMLVDSMNMNVATPSHAQAIKMKKFSQDGKLDDKVIESIMREEKPNQKEKPVFEPRISNLIPKNTPTEKQADFVVKALEHYNKFLQKQRENAR